jgi:hypothetical protein
MTHEDMDKVLRGPTTTVPLAGKLIGLSRKASYDAVARGEIPILRFGRRIVVPTAKLRAMLGMNEARAEKAAA